MRSGWTRGSDGRSRLQPRALTGKPTKVTKSNLRAIAKLDEIDDLVFIRRALPSARLGTARLQVVMLEDAYRDLVSHEEKFAETVWWIEGNAYSLPGFSFREVCENLDLDHEAWRSMLLQLAKEVHEDPNKRRKPKELSRQRMPRISA